MKKLSKTPLFKLNTFARTFRKSLASLDYYQDILAAKFSFSLKYLFVLLFVSSLLIGLKMAAGAVKILPEVPGYVTEAKKVLNELYPKELKITVKDKKISTNVKEPYFVDYPDKETAQRLPFKHLLVIDTQAKVDDFKKYQSFFLLTESSIVALDDQSGGYKVIPLEETFKDIPQGASLDKKIYDQMMNQVLPYLDSLPKFVRAGMFLGLLLFPFLNSALILVLQMLILVPTSFVFFLLARLLKKKLSYKNIYQLSMHGMTLPVIVSTAFSLANFSFPLASVAAFLIWMGIVIARGRF